MVTCPSNACCHHCVGTAALGTSRRHQLAALKHEQGAAHAHEGWVATGKGRKGREHWERRVVDHTTSFECLIWSGSHANNTQGEPGGGGTSRG